MNGILKTYGEKTMSNRQSGYTAVVPTRSSPSCYVRKSGYNIVTGPNNKVVAEKEDRRFRTAIERCSHLTPATEAQLDNLLDPGSVHVPSREEIIARNSPDFFEPIEDWDASEPSTAQLKEIEEESIEVTSD